MMTIHVFIFLHVSQVFDHFNLLLKSIILFWIKLI